MLGRGLGGGTALVCAEPSARGSAGDGRGAFCSPDGALAGLGCPRGPNRRPQRGPWWDFPGRPGHGVDGRAAGDIVHPVRVDAGGSFLSYELWPRALRKRDVSAPRAAPTFYALQYQGRELRFNLTTNPHLLAPGFVSETRRRGGLGRTHIRGRLPACHLLGEVQDPELEGGLAAISACDGLKGVFQLSDEDYFIEPLEGVPAESGSAQPHVVYKRQAPERETAPGDPMAAASAEPEAQRERWEQQQQGRRPRSRRLHQRSVSREKWVETLVVADTKMVEYHGQPQVESYVLTIMNMVAGLFRDPSIGNPIHITIVRLILLEEEEEDLKITHHADNTLRSFCRWQKSINMKGDAHPQHHDTAVLLTRKDLCLAMNKPCGTLGLAHVSGMCQPLHSCSINEDTGLPLAFTVAHELGHSFGIQHDGNGNDCEPVGKRPFIMSPRLLYDTVPLTWSQCSREYITRFLDRGWGLCLDDSPSKDVIDFPSMPPGVLYDVGHQCRLQYGANSTFCDNMDNVCHTLWCSVGTTCHSKLDSAVDGTRCGENKWCLNRDCVPVSFRPEAVDGGWSGWSAWSVCSRSCGVGVQSAERQCTQPVPKYKGKYCVGERKRFRLCSLQACPPGRPSFRQVQCSRFDGMLYKGQLHKWVPVVNDVNPCELHCRPSNEYFAEKLRDAVVDGTPCYPGRPSHDLCINGICKNVGCDFEIDSGAVEDRCGVCHGNGSTCHTVSGTFEESEGLGYVDVGLIPAGARDILIEEVAEAANFLALRSEDPERYFLNGGWAIQWNGDYPVAGTTFTYLRTGHWENLTSPGPTDQPVWIQLLFQESNPGVRYEYTIHREADGPGPVEPPEFSWSYGPWTQCTVTCGTGVQRQSVHCTERQAGPVDERHCDPLSRPDDRQQKCNEEPCPARWWAGEWQQCSSSCGPGGLSRRAVLCIQSVGLDEQSALEPPACAHLPRPPAETPCNRHVPCPATWAVGDWSQCSATCGEATQHRSVFCTNNTGVPCDEAQRPATGAPCSLPPCPRGPDPEGSGSGSPSHEFFNEIDFFPHRLASRPLLPQGPRPTSPPLPSFSTSRASPSPDTGDPGTVGTVAWEPVLGGGQGPVDTELGPPIGGAPSPPAPATLPATWGRAGPLEPGTPTPSAPWDLQTAAVPGTFLPMPTPGLEHPFWELAPGPGSEAPPSPVLLPAPAQDSSANSSRVPEAEPLDPSLAEDGPPAGNASWEVGNWSEVRRWGRVGPADRALVGKRALPPRRCSTTCGLGAVWRSVRCSSGREDDCPPAGRPQPARRCHLRPCAAWRTGNWSKCSRSCGGGSSVRDVQCVDMRDLRPLRPFHCQLWPHPSPLPACPFQCSEACGGGEQQRLVTCPEPGLCEETLRPNSTRACNTHPCTQWVVGPWDLRGQAGQGQRQLEPRDPGSGGRPTAASRLHLEGPPRPASCPVPAGCERDRLSFGFCETLRLLGRCQLPAIRTQCCRSCPTPGHGAPSRGHQRLFTKENTLHKIGVRNLEKP
uniref:ADAM metallopeptidase with thrombospondin type 1 motif 7 n=1 Tax=Neovison vison TaxID=452646 RepID=A0A8C7AU60_NEOVI